MKRNVRFRDEKDDADEIPSSRMQMDDGRDSMLNLSSKPAASSLSEFEKKHTLDSDEEDEPEKYQRFDAERFEGQEEATEEYDGKTKIMAFNMREEMEEGHFASDGTFIFDKKKNMIKDAWLDNINWDNVKNKAGKLWEVNSQESKEKTDEAMEEEEEVNIEQIFDRLLELLPNATETVGAALKRLNSEKGLSAAEERKRRWAAKKAGVPFENGNVKVVGELTALSDSLISTGNMSAYQLTADDIRSRLAKIRQSKERAPEPFDMFADEEPTASVTTSASTSSKPVDLEDNEPVVLWEFRVKDKEGNLKEKMHGPYNSDQMEVMRDEKLLQHGGIVRKLGTDKFYDLKRIDFELYS